MNTRLNSARCALALIFAALNAPSALGQTEGMHLKQVTIDQLKMTYMSCDRAVVRGELNTAAIMQCSVVYEELKRRAFEGDFEKFRAWSTSLAMPGSRHR